MHYFDVTGHKYSSVFSLYLLIRSGYLQFEYYYKLRGIAVGRFSAPSFLYADADEYPDNIGFCTPPGGTCAPTGLVNATECQSGKTILCLIPRTTVTSARILEEDACHRERNLYVFSRVQKETPRLMHKGCVL